MNDIYYKKIQSYTMLIQLIIVLQIAIDMAAFVGMATTVLEKGFVIAIVLIIGFSRNAVADANALYEASHNYDYVSFGRVLLAVCISITFISLWLFLTDMSASYSQSAIANHPSIKVAQSNLASTQKQLEGVRAGHTYSQEQLDSAIAEKARVDSEIQAAQIAFENANKQAIAAYQARVTQFWARKVDGLEMSKIMDRDGNPLKSPYDNKLLMKSSAAKYFPEWQKLKSESPTAVANSSPVVQVLGQKQLELSQIVSVVNRLTKAQSQVAEAEKVLFSAQEKLSAQEIYPSLFMKIPQLTHGYITPLGGVTLFFVLILTLLVGLPIYLSRSIVFMRMKIENVPLPTFERPPVQNQFTRIFTGIRDFIRDIRAPKKQATDNPLDKTDVPMATVISALEQTTDIPKSSVQTSQPVDFIKEKPVTADVSVETLGQANIPKPVFEAQLNKIKRILDSDNDEYLNLSIPSMIKRFGMSHTDAEKIRDELVRQGYAVYTDKKRCIPLNRKDRKKGLKQKATPPLNGSVGMF